VRWLRSETTILCALLLVAVLTATLVP
jgi:hypothetical protein